MKSKKQVLAILIVAMSLATAWAIRGQFGHEQGAAWAGAIGGLAVVMVAQRKDWYPKMALIALASAIGWGAGGMISYGMVVGYGRADNFINAYYGLTMLFVIGALFGLLGGGLTGLVLDSTRENKVKWGSLTAEMVTGGLLTYFFLVEQIGFKMTPPRSEAWALVLGGGLAMLWHMARENRNAAMRTAIFAAFGGGFGFAFGNFMQVVGNVMEIPFNMWNVMEYSIGFFGGSGMAYGIFSSNWPVDDTKPKIWANRISLGVILVFIPLIVYRESLAYGHILRRLGEVPEVEFIASISTSFAAMVLLLMAVLLFLKLKGGSYGRNNIAIFLFSYLGVYTLMSYVVTGVFAGLMHINHHLYMLNIVLILLLYRNAKFKMFDMPSNRLLVNQWFTYLLVLLLFLALFALIAINIHGELPGAQNRFLVE